MGSGYQSFLRNSYWILRHGKSIPNQTGVIVSSLENGVLEDYQLASDGVDQARVAGELFLKELRENNIGLENVRICYSPFSRTTHTAKVVASVLDIPLEGPQCKVVHDLRERFFGSSFELKSHDKYSEIWALDAKDPFLQPEGGESVADVATRLTSALALMESEFEGCTVLIVSHGDPLQILQTIMNAAKEDGRSVGNDLVSRIEAVRLSSILSQHRQFALDTAELRRLV
ncbi:metal-independent phosphoserine phosphatase-like isoform X1 [Salvia splendens]|uniref:metal-independent phosphoserine phosphatase-like isoform X1 n=1 Tax=Salvia splendens TaxID=180675 RepID=UPI001C279DD7|nr:metal-independent phosphoserine phosphatase-like isoform X1 [Salvia splendens]